MSLPAPQGLYDPANEHDSCGIGFVVDIRNRASRDIVRQGLQLLCNVSHRGAVGADPLAGDGAGILIQIPDALLRSECAALGIDLPPPGRYGAGMVFLPRGGAARRACEEALAATAAAEGQRLLGWRDVPVDSSVLGESVKPNEPRIRQIFIARGPSCADEDAFERKLLVIRKVAAAAVKRRGLPPGETFYTVSLSARTLCYKGMMLARRLDRYYPDLADERIASALAMVHQRFSTNTFPSWQLAHPYRYLCHNGEINTVRGNINWMNSRRHAMRSPLLGDDLDKLWPIIQDGISDSATFDNALELLVAGGYPLAHAMMLMIPEAWQDNPLMDDARRAFYEYHAAIMEPWDGPAAIAFTDGRRIGATLDRNGLRPARYVVTDDDRLILASEVGALDVPESRIVRKWRLQPGRMLLVDLREGRIIDDAELKAELAASRPWQRWLDETQIRLKDLPASGCAEPAANEPLLQRQQAFGYTREDVEFLMSPMAEGGEEAVGSMGADNPVAVLSSHAKPLANYFRQNFAQVTNPAIDSIREQLVTSLISIVGPRPNLLDLDHAAGQGRIEVEQPILTNRDLHAIREIERHTGGRFHSRTIDVCYPADRGAAGMEGAVARICAEAEEAVRGHYNLLILSDRAVDAFHVAIPSLLATGAVHHHLVRAGLRTETGLIVETGAAREVHQFSTLAGYGAEAINPWLAYETLAALAREKRVNVPYDELEANYVKAIGKGLLKVMSKMGISTYQSYCGAQIFDAVGLSSEFVDRYFTGTATRVEGIGIEEIAADAMRRHEEAWGDAPLYRNALDAGGDYAFRLRGEAHIWTPRSVAKLQHAVRGERFDTFREFSALVNEQSERLLTLRGLFELRLPEEGADSPDPAARARARERFEARFPGAAAPVPIPIEAVEPAASIVKRFSTGAMSFGSISYEAHTTLAIAMNRIGGRSNTGEGGELSERYVPLPNGDSMRSAIKQVASGRFGVTTEYLVNADELQIKIAQGAKPGEGGQLPGHKVDRTIARVRYSTPGVGLISPPPHHDIYSIEDLAQLVYDLKNVNPRARVSVKLVSEVGVGTVAAGVSKCHADHVTIAGHDGGTGASPLTSIKHAGSPWEIGLAETHQTLVLNGLRGRIAVQVDGGIRTGRDVVVGALLGADEFGFATAPLVAAGCIMMRKCHLNTCPVGVATQDPVLRERFTGEPEHVINYFFFVAEEVRALMARLGFRRFEDLVGQSQLLDMRRAIEHSKARGLDFSRILHKPEAAPGVAIHNCEPQDHGLERALDHELIRRARPALEGGEPVRIEVDVRNSHRTVGAMLSGEVARRYGHAGLPDGSIHVRAKGTGGQSFGAFLARGVGLELQGDANDYVGKGLSGGRIAIYPARDSRLVPEENILIGNTVLYGAIAGECYFRGVAGERFAVRNSGAVAVVEGVGDHGCEYMTGGVVVVLGRTGRNFAAGMSGGIAYVYDEAGDFELRCNPSMVELAPIRRTGVRAKAGAPAARAGNGRGGFAPAAGPGAAAGGRADHHPDMTRFDEERLHGLVERHLHYTGSEAARRMLDDWEDRVGRFVKVMPVEFRRVLEASMHEEGSGLELAEAAL